MNYFIYGEESLLVEKKLKEIIKKEKVINEDIIYYDLEVTPLYELVKDALTPSFFSSKKFIVAKNPYFLTSKKTKVDFEESFEELTKYFSSDEFYANIVFVLDDNELDKRKTITKLILKNTEVYEIKRAKRYELSKIASSFFKDEKISITKGALDLLVERVDSTTNLKNEMEKLSCYSDEITRDDVEKLVSKKLEDNIFALSDSLIRKNLKNTFNLYLDLKLTLKEPTIFIAMLSNELRFLIDVVILKEENYDENLIVKELKAHPYRVKLALDKTNFIVKDDIEKALSRLFELDYKIKNGLIDRFIGFEIFLIESCL